MLPSNGVGLQEVLSPGWFPKVPDVFCLVLLAMKGAAAGKLLGKGTASPGTHWSCHHATAGHSRLALCCNSIRRDKFRSHHRAARDGAPSARAGGGGHAQTETPPSSLYRQARGCRQSKGLAQSHQWVVKLRTQFRQRDFPSGVFM